MTTQTGVVQLDPQVRRQLDERQEELLQKAQALAQGLRDNKERQLRNIQAMAEVGSCWALVELFIRYQAARDQLPSSWADKAIKELGQLRNLAEGLIEGKEQALVEKAHLELVKRVLGYTVWWHVWEVKRKSREKEERL